MMYEKLILDAEEENVNVHEIDFSTRLKGLYYENNIAINNKLNNIEKACILAEELGHYHTSYGNILDMNNTNSRKQELRARRWAFERLIPLTVIVQALDKGICNYYELANYLGLTEEFVHEAVNDYICRYGEVI